MTSSPLIGKLRSPHTGTGDLTLIGIIGAGTMGRRLAFDFARAGCDVLLYDAAPAVVADAIAWIDREMQTWENEERLERGTTVRSLACLHAANSLADAVTGVEFVLENVPEKLQLKRTVFAALAPLLGESAIIVSNTSSLPGSLMADASQRPDRFINANFSHLGHPKVEVMPHAGTSEETRARVIALLRATGFVSIELRQEQFGYATNRVWRAVKKEVLRQIAAGIITPQDIDRGWMLDWGVAKGPCALMDAIGLDVVRDIEQCYADESGDASDRPPPFLEQMIAAGRLGLKSGEGFYRYPDPEFARPGFLDRA